MRKDILTICFLVISSSIDAQQSDMKIGIGADLGIPYRGFMIHDSKTGFGGYIKGLKGISKASQITVTTGYSTFPAKESGGPDKATHSIFSILPGYRYTFRGLYIEPQAGYCSMHSKFEPANGFVSPTTRFTHSEFMWAIGLGYQIHNVEIGIRYQSSTGTENSLLGIHLGYNFLLRRK